MASVHGDLQAPPVIPLDERIKETAELMIEQEGEKLRTKTRTPYEEGRSQGIKDACRVLLLELDEPE